MNEIKIKKDFPILEKNITYLDSACVTLRPKQVIDKISEYYLEFPSCSNRSAHYLSRKVTSEIDKSRNLIKKFINANKKEEIIFTKNTTEGINLIANSLKLNHGDSVLLSTKEHNSTLVPFQRLKSKGINIKFFKFGNIKDFKKKLTKDVKLIATVMTSNIDGTSNPVKDIINLSHKNNSLVLFDGAQYIPHKKINVKKLGIDFLAFSGHKMLGPSGTGILYGKLGLLKNLNQFIIGGETTKNSTYNYFESEDVPKKFEAGLQNYAGIIGLGEAVKYLNKIKMKNIEKHETKLNKYLTSKLLKLGAIIIGGKDAKKRAGIISFNISGIDPHEISGILNESNIMIRSGMHCAHSWFNANNLNGSARISLYLYNTIEDCDKIIYEIKKIVNLIKN